MRTLFASFFIASFGFFGCSTSEDSTQRDAETTHDAATDMAPPDAKPDSHADVTPDQNVSPDVSPDVPAESSEPSLFATIVTSKGTIRVKLADDASPITVENFQRYADAQFFDGLIFHRVIAGFMIQGGGMEPGMKTRAPLFPPIVHCHGTHQPAGFRYLPVLHQYRGQYVPRPRPILACGVCRLRKRRGRNGHSRRNRSRGHAYRGHLRRRARRRCGDRIPPRDDGTLEPKRQNGPLRTAHPFSDISVTN